MPRPFVFYTTCVSAKGEDIEDMVSHDRCREITYRTALKHCQGLLQWADDMGYDRRKDVGLTLKDDWGVSYFKSVFRGEPCYYVVHSGIEHIWLRAG